MSSFVSFILRLQTEIHTSPSTIESLLDLLSSATFSSAKGSKCTVILLEILFVNKIDKTRLIEKYGNETGRKIKLSRRNKGSTKHNMPSINAEMCYDE